MSVLAVGRYSQPDREALERQFQLCSVTDTDQIAGLDSTERAQVRALAFKGHGGLTGAVMDLLPGLRLIANYGVGYDTIDVGAASERGIPVTNTPGVLSDDVADLAVAMWLAQFRRMRQAREWITSGNWSSGGEFQLNRKASGSRVGILGLGRIGREIADRLAAFRCEIHYFSRSPKETPGWTYHAEPLSLARAVDVLFVAVVGGAGTSRIVSADVIEALGPSGVLINIARGSAIDEPALLAALKHGRLGGAGLDVFWNEPAIDPGFLALDNVVLQPHQGSGTVETRAAMARLQRDNIAAFLAGQPLLTPVNHEELRK